MTEFFWAIAIIITTFACLVTVGEKFRSLRKCYYIGINLWASLLPILAGCLFVAILSANISSDIDDFLCLLKFREAFLSSTELVVMMMIAPLLFTAVGNFTAAALGVYILERMLLSPSPINSSLGLLLILACLTVITILADKIPWVRKNRPNFSAIKLREILILVMSFAALGITFSAMINIQEFSKWLIKTFYFQLSTYITLLCLIMLFIGWLTVALGLTRHFILPILCVPSLFAIAFVTGWPGHLLIVPFAAGLTLSLAVVDRRVYFRPHS